MKKSIKNKFIALILVLSMLVATACSSYEPENGQTIVTEAATQSITPQITDEPTKVIEAATPVPTEAINSEKKDSENPVEKEIVTPTEDLPATGREEPATGDGQKEHEYDKDDIMGLKYTEFNNVDEKAIEVASLFMEGYVFGDIDKIIETLAYDEGEKETVLDELSDWEGFRDYAEGSIGIDNYEITPEDMKKILSLKTIGGLRFENKEDILNEFTYSELFISDPEDWDNYQLVSVVFDGLFSGFLNEYIGAGINAIVAEKNGEYKVVYAYTMDEYDDEPISEEEAIALIDQRKYKLNGSEKAEDVLNLFLDGLTEFDFFKLFTATAVDEDKEFGLFSLYYNVYESFEMMRIMNIGYQYVEIGGINEVKDVSEEELKEVTNNYSLIKDSSNITDIVKFEVTIRFHEGEDVDETVEDFYVGKINGIYQVLDNMIFSL